ncbi:type II toxin-antitoxin system VapC family toxin [Candidatus Poriferisodalis sp.]|uniref:type II toxin-antitoxin system VapC family toxin n=1 Tax=Candidatus Poriferisodalis sp. TaxID=3101277 RepID=UPI003B014369
MLLLDTHVVVWLIAGELHRLPRPAAEGLLSALNQGRVAVSAASFWELALKLRKRPERLPSLPRVGAVRTTLLDQGIAEVPVTGSLWIDAVTLAEHGFHDDPADQLIVASAIATDRELVTSDQAIVTWARTTEMLSVYAGFDGMH